MTSSEEFRAAILEEFGSEARLEDHPVHGDVVGVRIRGLMAIIEWPLTVPLSEAMATLRESYARETFRQEIRKLYSTAVVEFHVSKHGGSFSVQVDDFRVTSLWPASDGVGGAVEKVRASVHRHTIGKRLDANEEAAKYQKGRRRYRFDMQGAEVAGKTRHPQLEILDIAPDASDFEPVTIADCWLFEANEIQNLPDFVREVRR